MSISEQLLARSNRLGSNPKNTNYAGGNTSAKGFAKDPVTGELIELMWVKGSGGDLGTLNESGLSVLRMDRLRSLEYAYVGVEQEDQMVGLFDYCLQGTAGAAPSIDTAMHAMVEAQHIDHLHPDSVISIATARDSQRITKEIYGNKVIWVPWRRPGFQLGLDIRNLKQQNPDAIGCILGGHGLTSWGETSQECEENSLWIIKRAERYIVQSGRKNPLDINPKELRSSRAVTRRGRAGQLAPLLRGIASTDRPAIGHFSDSKEVLSFMESPSLNRLAALGTSCPDHFLRTKVWPMVLDLDDSSPIDNVIDQIKSVHQRYREDYERYYQSYATKDSPPMRGSDPAIILVPGVGMFSFGSDKKAARLAGEFYLSAINVIRGAESISAYEPISDQEKFRIEYWSLEEAKLKRMPKSRAMTGRVALVTGGASGIGKAIVARLVDEGACVVIADLNLEEASLLAQSSGGSDVAIAVKMDVTKEKDVSAAFQNACLAYGGVDLVVNNAGLSLSKPLLETTEQDWDLQHDVMAKGSFLVSREAAKIMAPQAMGGDIIYISSKNSVFAGPNNIAYAATKADQSHQVRLLAAELGEHGIRVNGINPDGVVRGSGIFAGGWGASRAAVYGIPEKDLGNFYAQRTILKREVLPENIANAVLALTAGELNLTTGLHIPVDGGIAAAFLR